MHQIDSDQYDNELDFGDIAVSLSQEDVKEHPHDCIGYLLGHDSRLYYRLCRGTGFLIGPNLVLTVAHNIYNRVEKTQNIDFIFYPGVSGQFGKKDGYKVVDIRFPEKYKTCAGNETLKYDYALLKLDRNVLREKYIELGINYVHNKQVLAMYGYRDCDNSNANQKGLWKANAHQTDLPTIKHQITTLEGNSGSPLLVRRNGRCVAIGIHKGGKKGTEYNGGRAITSDLIMDLLVWEKEMASDIRFCLMTASPSIATEVQSDAWLAQFSLKASVCLSGLQEVTQPSSLTISQTVSLTLSQPVQPLPSQQKVENISSNQSSPAKVGQTKAKIQESSSSKQINPLQIKPPQIINNAQQLSIEIKEKYLSDIATALQKKLSRMPADQKQQITSLTLKVTVSNEQQSEVFIKIYSRNDRTIKKKIAACVKQLKGLSSFNFYFRFQLINHESFSELRDALNSLSELTRINIVVDPSRKQSQQKSNWTQGWAKGKDPNKCVKYEEWDWN